VSKISPLGQSMASLFSPEGEKIRAAQKDKAGNASASSQTFRVPGAKALQESGKPQDSLGNPSGGLGYEPFRKEKKKSESNTPNSSTEETPNQKVIETRSVGSQFIRLSMGWEKILVAQKKLCEKAKNLFTSLEAPDKYHGQKRSNSLLEKSRGSILDLDVQEVANEKAASEKNEKKVA
jgi:hypothetical protein